MGSGRLREDPGRLIQLAVQNVSAAIRTRHTGSPFLERMSPSRQEDPRIRRGAPVLLQRVRAHGQRTPGSAGGAGLSAAPLPICYAFFRLLRSLSLRYASSSRTVEGRGA